MDGRYLRQIILPEIGADGQKKLSTARAAVVGAGGLGSPVLYYLASAGVNLLVIDGDNVDLSNLNRQFIHSEPDIGRNKAVSAAEKIRRLNSEITIETASVYVNDDNSRTLFSGCDIVVSCVDSKEARYAINRGCVSLGIPLADGGIRGFTGYVLTAVPGVTPCYNCVFPEEKMAEDADSGVLGAAAGVVGSFMTVSAVKMLLGRQTEPCLNYIDTLSFEVTGISAARRADCGVCG